MSSHSRRTRANNRTLHQRGEAKAARRKARKAKVGLIASPPGPELIRLPKGTRIIPPRSARSARG